MKDRIIEELSRIERDEDVRVLYACESGSRAWGFPSADSDFDVRFIYSRRRDWYLSIDLECRRDVIERPITDELDVSGWDLRKALMLFRKSNPPMIEWLSSPIVYADRFDFASQLRGLTGDYFSPTSCLYHYLHMARGNYRDYLQGDEVRIKKYFYVLRPLLAIMWIEAGLGPVPMEFEVLVDRVIDQDQLKSAIAEFVARKILGVEWEKGPRIPPISEFIEFQMNRLANIKPEPNETKPDIELLNRFFRGTIDVVWSEQM